MGTRKTYSAEFKRQAVQLATQLDHTVDEIARDLGIGRSTLSNWIRMAKEHGELAFPGKGKARLTPEQEELKRLRKENELLRQERDILKSAAVWFFSIEQVWGSIEVLYGFYGVGLDGERTIDGTAHKGIRE